jgi:hypothetical protein
VQPTATIPPFWERINLFFLFPFQAQPLIYAVCLGLSSLLVHVLFFLHSALSLALVFIGILLATTRYGFKVMQQASFGQFDSSQFPSGLDSEIANLPWKMFGVTLVLGFVAGLAQAFLPKLDWLISLAFSLALPAVIVTLVVSMSFFQALVPSYWFKLIGAMGWRYLLLCGFLFLLNTGMQVSVPILLKLFGPIFVWPFVIFSAVYFSWVMCSLLGYVMFQYHEALGYTPDYEEAYTGDKAPASPAAVQAALLKQEDAYYAELLAQGDVQTARDSAYEAQRERPDDVQAHKRYHGILLLDDHADRLCEHAQKYLALLSQRKLYRDAINVVQECRQRMPQFHPNDGQLVHELGQYALKAADPALCVKLINGFDKLYPGHAATPQIYELAARSLLQMGSAKDKLVKIATVMQQRYPDHPSTQEVLWLSR